MARWPSDWSVLVTSMAVWARSQPSDSFCRDG